MLVIVDVLVEVLAVAVVVLVVVVAAVCCDFSDATACCTLVRMLSCVRSACSTSGSHFPETLDDE